MKRLRSLLKKLVHRLFQLFHKSFYSFIFGRSIPGSVMLERLANAWERRERRGDIPVAAETWNSEYQTGRWTFMEDLDELARYMVLAGYLIYLKPKATILDVGCGQAILCKRLQSESYAKYVGLDISEVALAKPALEQNAQTVFIRADAEIYQPSELFDVIVFNETLYYFHSPNTAFDRYAQALQPKGIMIVSTYVASRRAMAILRLLKTKYTVVDETQIQHGAKAWICTVFMPDQAISQIESVPRGMAGR